MLGKPTGATVCVRLSIKLRCLIWDIDHCSCGSTCSSDGTTSTWSTWLSGWRGSERHLHWSMQLLHAGHRQLRHMHTCTNRMVDQHTDIHMQNKRVTRIVHVRCVFSNTPSARRRCSLLRLGCMVAQLGTASCNCTCPSGCRGGSIPRPGSRCMYAVRPIGPCIGTH